MANFKLLAHVFGTIPHFITDSHQLGILRERHEDHIVLENGTKIFLTSKQTAGGLSPGTSLTVAYTAKRDGRKVADNIWSGS